MARRRRVEPTERAEGRSLRRRGAGPQEAQGDAERDTEAEAQEASQPAQDPLSGGAVPAADGPADAAPADAAPGDAAPADGGAGPATTGRDAGERARERFLSIARRRAAHFAHFNSGEEGDEVAPDGETGAGIDDAGEGPSGSGQAANDSDEPEQWPGPFAVARQLVAGRAAAQARRGLDSGEKAKRSAASAEFNWVPKQSRGSASGPAAAEPPVTRRAPRLYDMCARVLCDESEQFAGCLGALPDHFRSHLMRVLCARRKLSGNLLVELVCGEAPASGTGPSAEDSQGKAAADKGGKKRGKAAEASALAAEEAGAGFDDVQLKQAELRVRDCSLITEDDMQKALRHAFRHGLEVLELNFCGRCLSDVCILNSLPRPAPKHAASLPATGSQALPHVDFKLKELIIGGAYRLTEKGLNALLGVEGPAAESGKDPTIELQVLHLSDCSLLSGPALSLDLWQLLAPSLHSLALDSCINLNAAELVSALELLAATAGAYVDAAAAPGTRGPGLRHLSLAGLPGLTDALLTRLVKALGPTLESLCLADCNDLGDKAIQAIGTHCPHLRSLDLSHVSKVSDAGLQVLATGCLSLRTILLTRVSKLTAEGVADFITTAGGVLQKVSLCGINKVNDDVVQAMATYCHASLEELDASWCRGISDAALGYLADTCPNLKRMLLYGCSQVTPFFFNGHSNPNLELVGLVATTKA